MAATVKPFIIPVFIPNAGCPHRCLFCDQSAITCEPQSHPTPASLRTRIESYLQYKGMRKPVQVAFYGGNFLGLDRSIARSMLIETDVFVQRGDVDGIRFSTRPDTIDPARLALLDTFPISTVELGVQSMSNQVLIKNRRGHSAEQTCRAVSLLRQRPYDIGLQMMIGLPGDNEQTALETADRMVSLSPDFVRIYPTVVLAGSPLAGWLRSGAYVPMSLDDAVSLTKKLYLIFRQHRIPVIRMGLQASADLDDGTTVLAGPYHPAFGHLVHAGLFMDKAIRILKQHPKPIADLCLCVHPASISRMQGLHRKNITRLKQEFGIRSIKIVPDESLEKDQLTVC